MPLNIPLLNGWTLRSDTANIILSKQSAGVVKYYNTIQAALQSFIELSIKEMDCTSFKELVLEVGKLKEKLAEILAPLGIALISDKKGLAVSRNSLNATSRAGAEK